VQVLLPVLGLALSLCAGFVAAQSGDAAATLPAGVRVVVSGHNLPADSYSLLVQEVNGATPILAINPELPLNPASTIKTLTTLAALEELGANYAWNTGIYALGPVQNGTLEGDLLIKGGGDPFLVEEYFRTMLRTLQRRGVERISGDLIIDASYFDASVSRQTAIDNQTSRTYNVLPHALAVNFQTVNFFFYPHPNGKDVIIKPEPELPNLNITNRLRLGNVPCGGFQRGVSFVEDPADPNGVIFEGSYPSRCSEYVLPRAVLDAPNYAYGLFRLLWQELGGDFAGGLRLGLAPEEQEPLVTGVSPPLGDVIKSINKYSNNLMTRQLLLTLGVERYGAPATVDNGIRAVREYLAGVGIDHSPLVMVNGAGLSREVRLTSTLLGAVLRRGYNISTMAEFIASLPLGGVDGTMRNRLRNGASRGNMHIKTGSLDGVSAIAGYVHARSGKQYVVVGLLNHELADRGPGTELMDALLAWAYAQ
jgi:D-alanyl-D-alanine carboxypeptidase/D-alanyl-D-alanine-endopeptidase (penicillin-binding protein 4)